MRTYYYIDDETDTVQSIADAINESQRVIVTVFPLARFKEFDKLTEKLMTDWDSIDGLILDLKLNGGGPNSTKYTATSLAQWLLSFVVTERRSAKPLILLSNDLQCANYNADITSHDLFDLVFERRGDIEWGRFAQALAICAEEYAKLNADVEKELTKILDNEDIDESSTCFTPFTDPSSFNVSQFASFILNDLFVHPGLLISERLLASRLGIDISKSGDYWIVFKDKYFGIARYSGAFGELKERYWSAKAIDVFTRMTDSKSLASLSAQQRVDFLKSAIPEAANLVAYTPEGHSSSAFCWTIDEVTGKPLDASEGYMIYDEGGIKSWQEPRYLSFDTIETGMQGPFKLVPSEKERFIDDLEAIEG